MGEYLKAALLYHEGLQIIKNTLGINYPLYNSTLKNLGFLYQNMGMNDRAEKYYLESSQLSLHSLLDNFNIFSEKEKGNYIDVDDVYEIRDILPDVMKEAYRLVITKQEQEAVNDELRIG